jgi:hypothetical protein
VDLVLAAYAEAPATRSVPTDIMRSVRAPGFNMGKAKLVAKKGSVCVDRGNFIAFEVLHPGLTGIGSACRALCVRGVAVSALGWSPKRTSTSCIRYSGSLMITRSSARPSS